MRKIFDAFKDNLGIIREPTEKYKVEIPDAAMVALQNTKLNFNDFLHKAVSFGALANAIYAKGGCFYIVSTDNQQEKQPPKKFENPFTPQAATTTLSRQDSKTPNTHYHNMKLTIPKRAHEMLESSGLDMLSFLSMAFAMFLFLNDLYRQGGHLLVEEKSGLDPVQILNPFNNPSTGLR